VEGFATLSPARLQEPDYPEAEELQIR